MNSKNQIAETDQRAGGPRRFIPGILTYGSLQPNIFKGGARVDQALREQARERDPRARNRREPEIAYQWTSEENDLWMRLYTSIDAKSLMTRAQRTGKAKIRLTVRDAKSKQTVVFASGSVEIERDEQGWEAKVRELVDRGFLFISRNRPACPLCRTPMEIRTGKRGQFWGCQSFPGCRGTRHIPDTTRRETEGKAPETGQPTEPIGNSSAPPPAAVINPAAAARIN